MPIVNSSLIILIKVIHKESLISFKYDINLVWFHAQINKKIWVMILFYIGIVLKIHLLKGKSLIIIHSNNDKSKIIAKLDSNTGKTLWAKVLLVIYKFNMANILTFLIDDDNAWVRIISKIVKLFDIDSNGYNLCNNHKLLNISQVR